MLVIKHLKSNFVRYLLSGIVSFLVDYITLLFLYKVLGIVLPIAVTVGFTLALVVNFLLNKLWAFESIAVGYKSHAKELVSYLLLVGFNLVFTNFVIVQLAHHGVGPAVSKIFTVGCITLWNYYIYKRYIFKPIYRTD